MSTRLSHPLLKFILFFTLAITIAMPTTALAARPVQPTTTAELLAYYETEVIADETSDGAIAGLSFYDDDTFELSIDFQSDEETSVAYGDYVETDDGVTLTLVGADGEDFDEPTDVELTFDADDSLVLAGSPDGLFGEEDLIFYPTDVEAGDDTTGDDTDDTTGDDTDEEIVAAVGGVYISPVQPNDGTDGVVYMLNLAASGDASLSSDYLDLTAPIFEVGTWTDNGDNTVSVEITGTPDEEYDDAIALEFELGTYGELMLDELSLYPVAILSYLEDDGSADTGEEADSADDGVTAYVTEITVPDETEPIQIYMLLYDDGSVLLSDEEETSTLYGEWSNEDDVLYVTITGDDEADLDEPVEFVFEMGDDSELIASEYPVDVFGEDGLTFYPVDEGDDAAATEGEFYFYESDTLPSTETDGIVISLLLSDDGGAMVSTDLMNDEDPVAEYGEWTRDEDDNVVVTINEGPDGTYDEPYVFTFEEDPDDFSLTLVGETVEVFGDFELVLNRVE